MTITSPEFDQRHAVVTAAISDLAALRKRIVAIEGEVEKINIYHPLKTFQTIRRLRSDRASIGDEVDKISDRFEQIITVTLPAENMGQILTSTLDTQRLWIRILRLQMIWNDINNASQYRGAMAFGVFSLYIAIVSFIVSFLSLITGIIPLWPKTGDE